MKSWDVVIIGGGIIGLSLAISLRKQGLRVLLVERGEPGREASNAAAGMLAGSGSEIPVPLQSLAEESARLYPEFVHELEDESGIEVDLRQHGTILISHDGKFPEQAEPLSLDQLHSLEPELGVSRGAQAAFLSERSLDPRALVAAAIKAARHRGADISSGTVVKTVLVESNRVTGVETDKTSYSAPLVVNCAGAWSGCVGPEQFPVKPIKGQMLALVGCPVIKHVVRSEKVYLVPRSDGRLVIGSTLENVGYNKQTDANKIQQFFQAAIQLAPGLAGAKQHDAWAGLRPGTPDELPILAETSTPGYFVATGHYRDGILLAPITALVMTDLVLGKSCTHDLRSFAVSRFSESNA
jgi:glycine oxidase